MHIPARHVAALLRPGVTYPLKNADGVLMTMLGYTEAVRMATRGEVAGRGPGHDGRPTAIKSLWWMREEPIDQPAPEEVYTSRGGGLSAQDSTTTRRALPSTYEHIQTVCAAYGGSRLRYREMVGR